VIPGLFERYSRRVLMIFLTPNRFLAQWAFSG
jgi:hypothetical protein